MNVTPVKPEAEMYFACRTRYNGILFIKLMGIYLSILRQLRCFK